MTSPRKTVSPHLSVRHFLLPKRAHSLSECEDALGINSQTNRFAVADGATEAFDSANWAQRLAEKWANADGLLSPQEFWRWLENEGEAHDDSWDGVDLPWYAMEKRRGGSFAAFVGIEIESTSEAITWNAIALGDSCLVHSRKGSVVTAFPISNSAGFGWAPVLAPSRTNINPHAKSEVVVTSGQLDHDDQLLLLSDAVAAWFLMLSEQHDTESKLEFHNLLNAQNDTGLPRFLERERSAGRLKDDDIAIVAIELVKD